MKGYEKTKFAISNWISYTKMKASIANAGEEGQIFAVQYKTFKKNDLSQIIGVYILDDLSPSHRLIQKMQTHSKQQTHGKDFISNCFGSGYEAKYRHFRHFFDLQDPMMMPPKKLQFPKYKVDEFFRWNRHIWKEKWTLNRKFSIDEQTCNMQGKSEYKTRCGKFKRIGDGIQTDYMADDGYTYDFYFRNEPVDKKWLDMENVRDACTASSHVHQPEDARALV